MAAELKAKQHLFDGEWLPSVPAVLVGPENFLLLQNMRPTNKAIAGVLGYSRINETVLPGGYTGIRNGHQLITADGTEYIFVQAEYAPGSSKLFVMEGSAPDPAEFTVAAVHTDATGAGVGRFSEASGGQVIYCNGVESLIWGGRAFRCAAAFLATDASLSDPKDLTEAANNTLADTQNIIPIDTSDYPVLTVFSTRPLQGVGLTVKTANTSTSSLAVAYWNGTAFASVSGLSDGTASGGKALAQTGNVSWTSTVGNAKPKHFEGLYFYCYRITLSAGSADISHITVDMPLQPLVDIWDGVFRTITQFQASRSSKYEDYTLEVNEESSVHYPICALIGGLTSSDHVVVQSTDRLSGMRVKMSADNRNATAATLTLYYWDGDSWVAASGLEDGTDVSGASLGQTGVISWAPPNEGQEFPRHLFGSTGYCYKLSWSATLTTGTDHDGTSVDLAQGIPAQLTVPAYMFAASFKGATLLLDRQDSNERNRIDYSLPNAPDVYNGDMASNLGEGTLYSPGAAALRAATSIFNRFGSNIYDTLIVLADGATYLLNGDDAESYQLYTISKTVGCPAPLTLVAAEAGFELTEGVTRNVALWLSFSGPYMFDGAVLYPLKGLEVYFDPSETSKCINFEAITRSRAWFDPLYREYNLLLPTGDSTECDLWVVYDLVRKKWFEKNPTITGALMPQAGFTVLDSSGRRHCYGGVDSGRLVRLEHGTSWDGEYIWQIFETGDFWPANSVWLQCLLRAFKLIARRIDEEHNASVVLIQNTIDPGYSWFEVDEDSWFEVDEDSWFTLTPGEQLSLDLSAGNVSATIAEGNVNLNQLVRSCRWRCGVKTKDTAMGFQPLMYGYLYREERVDRL